MTPLVALVLEELSRGDAGLGTTMAVHSGAGTMPILLNGTDEQIERLVDIGRRTLLAGMGNALQPERADRVEHARELGRRVSDLR